MKAIDNLGDTVLMKACKESWDDIVKYLISNHSNTININQQDKVRKYYHRRFYELCCLPVLVFRFILCSILWESKLCEVIIISSNDRS